LWCEEVRGKLNARVNFIRYMALTMKGFDFVGRVNHQNRSYVQQKRIKQISRMSIHQQSELASQLELDWSSYDALLFTKETDTLRILIDREDLSPLWRIRALRVLIEKSPNPLLDGELKNLIQKAIEDSKTPPQDKQALIQELNNLNSKSLLINLGKLSSDNQLHLSEHFDKLLFIIEVEDVKFKELFKGWRFPKEALLQYAIIVDFLVYSSYRVNQESILNSSILNEFMRSFPNQWQLPNPIILNWRTDIFATFLILVMENHLDRVDTYTLFENLKSITRFFNSDLDDLHAKAQLKYEENCNNEAKAALAAKEKQARDAESNRLGMARAAERVLKEKQAKRIELLFQENKNIVERNSPWPVTLGHLLPEVQQKLQDSGIIFEEERAYIYRPFPIQFDRVNKNLILDQGLKRVNDLSYRKKSILESFTREFPRDKQALVKAYHDFARYLDHKKRYLCDSISLTLSNSEHNIRLRIDQVALVKAETEFEGCWVITVYGIPDYMIPGIKAMNAQSLGEADFIKTMGLNAGLVSKLNSVYFVKKKMPDGARSWIGLLIELIDITFDFKVTDCKVALKEHLPEVFKHREKIFESAQVRTLWQGERSSGPGTDFCQKCGHEIWDAPSIARGFGPDCWKKIRFTERGRAVISTSKYLETYDEIKDQMAVPYSNWIYSIVQDLERFSLDLND
jgi:hypothetical protein